MGCRIEKVVYNIYMCVDCKGDVFSAPQKGEKHQMITHGLARRLSVAPTCSAAGSMRKHIKDGVNASITHGASKASTTAAGTLGSAELSIQQAIRSPTPRTAMTDKLNPSMCEQIHQNVCLQLLSRAVAFKMTEIFKIHSVDTSTTSISLEM